MSARRPACLLLALAILALSIAAGGCGSESKTDIVEGEPVELGELEYNVLFSRLLNPNDVEDEAYLLGQAAPQPDQVYFGVFMEVENNGEEPVTLPTTMTVIDTEGDEYSPLPTESPYALRLGGRIGGGDQAPALDSSAQTGPIEGALVLFAIPDSAIENNPLRLEIPGEDGPAEVELDI
jgi:hypothetical protein